MNTRIAKKIVRERLKRIKLFLSGVGHPISNTSIFWGKQGWVLEANSILNTSKRKRILRPTRIELKKALSNCCIYCSTMTSGGV